jgi:eukaryotic-like serine/threonine-protein kinase
MAPADHERDPTVTGQPETIDERRSRPSDSQLTGLSDYRLGEVIGSGGMGEVMQARDNRIGRDVAIKRMRDDNPSQDKVERFLREAKIQARLDHPAIVPVHELGFDTKGRPYFSMKRLTGVTMTSVLSDGSVTQQRLLRALVEVCNAIDLAHARGVVHRDLKPSNIMLGEYGEVYVIDWGVARVLGTRDSAPAILEIDHAEDGTMTGQMLGTPGYMAPEQIKSLEVGPAADVYGLGAILFEIVAGERLHPSGAAALVRTLEATELSPALRAPERAIPPELDAICVAALQTDPERRPSVRELGEAIQRFLDGDRDVERRRVLARELSQRAQQVHRAEGDRAEIVRLAGRAVALDPECRDAGELLTALLLEPPKVLTPEQADEFRAEEQRSTRVRGGRAVKAYLSFFLATPMFLLLEVRSWALLVATITTIMLMASVSLYSNRVRVPPVWVFAAVQLAGVLMFSRFASPMVMTPTLVAGILVSITAVPWFNERKWAVIAWTFAAMAVPIVLEATGVLAPTWHTDPQGLVTHGSVFAMTPASAYVTVVSNAMMLLALAFYTLGIARDRRAAQRHIYAQAWQLKQLLPSR